MTWNSTTRVLVSSKQESLTTRDFLWRTTPSTLLLLLLLIRRSLRLFQTLDSRQRVVHSGRPFVRARSSSEFFSVFVFSFNCNNRQRHDLRENQNEIMKVSGIKTLEAWRRRVFALTADRYFLFDLISRSDAHTPIRVQNIPWISSRHSWWRPAISIWRSQGYPDNSDLFLDRDCRRRIISWSATSCGDSCLLFTSPSFDFFVAPCPKTQPRRPWWLFRVSDFGPRGLGLGFADLCGNPRTT